MFKKAFDKVGLSILLAGAFIIGLMKMLASFLSPPRKSAAREQVEKLQAEIQKRHEERAVEAEKQVAVVEAQAAEQQAQDPVDFANEIIKRN